MTISGVSAGAGQASAALASARQQEASTAVLAKTQDVQKAEGEAALSLIESAAQAAEGIVSADKVDVYA